MGTSRKILIAGPRLVKTLREQKLKNKYQIERRPLAISCRLVRPGRRRERRLMKTHGKGIDRMMTVERLWERSRPSDLSLFFGEMETC